jgi:threonine/homoserine/homoserine lactone efflux protein
MEILFAGMGFGLLLALMIGPVFFALLQDSLEKGFRAGIFMALGVVLSDAAYVGITNVSIQGLRSFPWLEQALGFTGSALLITYGMVSLLKPKPVARKVPHITSGKFFTKQFLKGFLLNGINPFVLLFWLGMASYVNVTYGQTLSAKLLFFGGILTVVLMTDLLKVFAAKRLSALFTQRLIMWLNRLVGLLLIVFGIRLLLSVW